MEIGKELQVVKYFLQIYHQLEVVTFHRELEAEWLAEQKEIKRTDDGLGPHLNTELNSRYHLHIDRLRKLPKRNLMRDPEGDVAQAAWEALVDAAEDEDRPLSLSRQQIAPLLKARLQ